MSSVNGTNVDAFLALASKEATYSTAFIAMSVACLAIVIFEYFQNLELESKYIWSNEWHIVKWLYYLNRFSPLLMIASALSYSLIDSPSLHTCKNINICTNTFSAVCHLVSEMVLYLRVWAISGQGRKLGSFLIGNAVVVFFASIVCLALYLVKGEWGAKETVITGCITHSRSSRELLITVVFALLLYSGIVVMLLCVYFGIGHYRIARPGPLLVAFYQDGTIYFLVVAAMSITNAIVTVFVPKFSRFVVIIPYSMFMTVIVTRMILHLRQVAQITEADSFGNNDLRSSAGRNRSAEEAETMAWEVK